MSSLSEEVFKAIVEKAKPYFKESMGGHDWLHVERVHDLCVKIGMKEGADLDVVRAAALLHDIGMRTEVERRIDHAEESAKIAAKILREVGFPAGKIGRVVYAIRAHRFSKKLKPKTLEAKVLQDADRLDAIGAIGVARAFAYGGARGVPMYDLGERPARYGPGRATSTITHFYEKLLKVKRSMNTEEGKRLAEGRHRFTKRFLTRFLAEVRGLS